MWQVSLRNCFFPYLHQFLTILDDPGFKLLLFAPDFAKSESSYLHQFFTDSLKTENAVYSMYSPDVCIIIM